MSLLWADSFGGYATADVSTKYTTVNGAPTIRTTEGPRGGPSMELSSTQRITKTVAPGDATCIIGASWHADSGATSQPSLFAILDGATRQITLNLNTDMTLRVARGNFGGTALGTTTKVVAQNTWYTIELKVLIHASAGTVDLKVDGVSWLSLTGQNTRNSATAQWTAFEVGAQSSELTFNYAELYVLDGVASADATHPANNFLYPYRMDPSYVTGAGTTTMFTPSAGANWQNVDEDPVNTTDYNTSTAAADKDTFVTQDAPVAGVLLGYQVNVFCQKTDAGVCTVAAVIRSGGTDYVSAAQAVSTTFAYVSFPYSVDPATSLVPTTSAWDAGETGYDRVA